MKNVLLVEADAEAAQADAEAEPTEAEADPAEAGLHLNAFQPVGECVVW